MRASLRRRLAVCLATVALAAAPARARVLATQEEALAAAFPGASIERTTRVLAPEQSERVKALGGSAPESRAVIAYRAVRDGALVGTAYFDAHVVRTLPEVVMVVVAPDGTAARVDVLAFREPPEYLAPAKWLAQFHGRSLSPDLQVKRAIHGITGATLTARAATRAVRRILAVHQVLTEAETEPDAGS